MVPISHLCQRWCELKVGYIVHNLNDPAVERRCEMLERGGASISLAGFCRDDQTSPAIRLRDPMVLGRSADAAMVQRALATFKAAFLNARLAAFFADSDVIMARNLEQLAIASRLRGERALVYECLDIHRTLTGENPAAKAIQFVESQLLPGVDLLLTSSPAFLRHHFDDTAFKGRVQLVENKVLVADGEWVQRSQPAAQAPIVIGWFGMLRCVRTLEFLSDLAALADGQIKVLICGKPSPAEFPDFESRVAASDHLTYRGPYAYRDLPDLYGQCHFAWAIDWFEEGLNSSWLLPNRIYEAAAHGAVPIGLADVEVGRWLARCGVGLCVKDAQDARDQLLSMDLARVRQLQGDVGALDPVHVTADLRDCNDLVSAIAAAGAS